MKTLKNLFRIIVPAFLLLLVSACDTEGTGKKMTIGGDTDYVENQVGATAKGVTTLDGASIADIQSKVVENSGGMTTFETTIPVPPTLQGKEQLLGDQFVMELLGQSVTSYMESGNKVKLRIKAINSSEGFALINSTGKQVVIMKYDANEGDKWSHKREDGKTVEFKVTHHSTTDDYRYGLFNIKVVKVEHLSIQPGYSKVVFIGNHKFGLVGIELYLEDGSVIKSTKM